MSKAKSRDGVAKVEKYREDLEDLAQSDLACADIAAALLDLEGDV